MFVAPLTAEVCDPQTWGVPIIEERPASASRPPNNYIVEAGGDFYTAINLGRLCYSGGRAYALYGTANTVPAFNVGDLIEGLRPETVAETVHVRAQPYSQLERTIASLYQYRMLGSDYEKPASDALRFLDALPKYLPTPRAAMSETGMITMFWHVGNFYADAEFHGDGTLNIFTRERVAVGNKDESLEGEPIDRAITITWLKTHLAPMFPRSAIIAA
jgi:hypothetical protein